MVQPVSTNLSSAARIYQGMSSQLTEQKSGPEIEQQRVDFQDFVKDALNNTRTTLQNSEEAQIEGLKGNMGTQDVVEAVMAAELSIKTVTSVRDRAVQAYQELLRMPI